MPGRVAESIELRQAFEDAMRRALEEDLGDLGLDADITTRSTVPENLWGAATLYAKQDGVICGLAALRASFARLDARVTVEHLTKDGDDVEAGDALANVTGPLRPMLVGERAALNLIGHLSGIATEVRKFVRLAPNVELTDTRKTLPGLRTLQKYAVRTGGGSNHRFSLFDGVLVKDNHIAAAGGVGNAVRLARQDSALPVEAECTTLAEVDDALDAGAAAILLDNRSPDELRELTRHIHELKDFVLVEASGGVTLANIAEVAATGVDRISIGVFTHSSPSLDVSFRVEKTFEANGGA